ncbi:MAG: hypothetical protein U0903_04725 [Planctomycetales bacterium]
MSQVLDAATVKTLARKIGFDLVGIAAAGTPRTWPEFQAWLNNGYAGEMNYLASRSEAYRNPQLVLEGAEHRAAGAELQNCGPSSLSAGIRTDVAVCLGDDRLPRHHP